jgi:hypothetical protein
MLTHTVPRSREKRLCLFVRNEAFRQVLGGILREWGYSLREDSAASDLFLAEDGFPVPGEGTPVLWLTRSRYGERGRLCLPLSIEQLWATLESRFHKPPRSHIRINLELPAALEARSETDEILITSLSELGARFDLHRELAPGEELVLNLRIAGRRLKLPGRVIYVVPRGDLEGSGKAQIGVIFHHPDKELRDVLRDFILRSYLERVREGLAGNVFREGLSHFDVPPGILEEIGFP